MVGYFRQFPLEAFTFDGETFILEDITRRVFFSPDTFDNGVQIEELLLTGERPDQLAHMLYGDSNLWWTFFIINNITANEWPFTDEELDNLMAKNWTPWQLEQPYGHYINERVPDVGWRYFVADGQEIHYAFDKSLFKNEMPVGQITYSRGEMRTLRDQLVILNERKKRIYVLRPEFISEFMRDFKIKLRSDVDYSLI